MRVIQLVFFAITLLLSLTVKAGDLGDKLGDLFSFEGSSASDEILDPDVAFRVVANVVSENSVKLSWEIEPGYYLYKNKFSVESANPNLTLAAYTFPTGKLKQDIAFGEVEVYYNRTKVSVPFQITDAILNEFDITVAYQGCKEDSVCYPPIKKTLRVNNVVSDGSSTVSDTTIPAAQQPALLISEQDAITQKLKDKSLLINILSFFGFGFYRSDWCVITCT